MTKKQLVVQDRIQDLVSVNANITVTDILSVAMNKAEKQLKTQRKSVQNVLSSLTEQKSSLEEKFTPLVKNLIKKDLDLLSQQNKILSKYGLDRKSVV